MMTASFKVKIFQNNDITAEDLSEALIYPNNFRHFLLTPLYAENSDYADRIKQWAMPIECFT
jgi:hypothetical protein